ncbi:MAG TPA: cytochrome d ubiquinol oxidase subunit II [bacterium]|nr:cytochrome d ubiquinol oxidase subunit II [bacterium]
MTSSFWQTLWFILVGVLFSGYAILDGFDLGVGALHLLVKSDKERRTFLNSIGPIWDGNEVWLVTGGGALFAAFPEVYATVFSGFYLAFMLLLVALIFRAVAIEFRSKRPMKWWRNLWDVSFSVSSIISAFLIGAAMGNIAWGIPLGPDHEYAGDLLRLFKPYPLLLGVTTLSLFMMHGSIYLVLKTEGPLQKKLKGWVTNTMIFFILCYIFTTIATLLFVPHMLATIQQNPVLFIVPALSVLSIANIPRNVAKGQGFGAFLSSCAALTTLMALFGIGMYPDLVFSNPFPENSLNITNAASSLKTLRIMTVIAVIGMPLVLSYTASIYWIFRGKVKLDAHSY